MLERAAKELLEHYRIGMNAELLVRTLEGCEELVLEDEQELCSEGGGAQEMWILLTGFIEVRKRGIPGNEPLATIRGPALLGHMGLVNGTQRSASCRAKGRCDLLRLPASQFYALLSEQTAEAHVFRRLLIIGMSRQLELGNQKLHRVQHPNDLMEATVSLDGWMPRRGD